MADPLSGGGAAKVAEEMLKDVQQAMNQVDQAQPSQGAGGANFAQVMQTQQVNQVQDVRPPQSATDVLRAATQPTGLPSAPIGRSLDVSGVKNGVHRIVEDIMQGQNKYGKILDLAMSGRNFSHSELLALQAGVYRFSQELELTSKVIEKGTSAIKQTLNTQV